MLDVVGSNPIARSNAAVERPPRRRRYKSRFAVTSPHITKIGASALEVAGGRAVDIGWVTCQLRYNDAGKPAQPAQEERAVGLRGEAGKLRPPLAANSRDDQDLGAFHAGEEGLGRRTG